MIGFPIGGKRRGGTAVFGKKEPTVAILIHEVASL